MSFHQFRRDIRLLFYDPTLYWGSLETHFFMNIEPLKCLGKLERDLHVAKSLQNRCPSNLVELKFSESSEMKWTRKPYIDETTVFFHEFMGWNINVLRPLENEKQHILLQNRSEQEYIPGALGIIKTLWTYQKRKPRHSSHEQPNLALASWVGNYYSVNLWH